MHDTQWYCPPAVGYAERNSASDKLKHKDPSVEVTRPQRTETGPPLGRATDIEIDNAVHVLSSVKDSPNRDRNVKLRSSSRL